MRGFLHGETQMAFREITGSIASITGDATPGARFLVMPNDFVFSSGVDTMVLADAQASGSIPTIEDALAALPEWPRV